MLIGIEKWKNYDTWTKHIAGYTREWFSLIDVREILLLDLTLFFSFDKSLLFAAHLGAYENEKHMINVWFKSKFFDSLGHY